MDDLGSNSADNISTGMASVDHPVSTSSSNVSLCDLFWSPELESIIYWRKKEKSAMIFLGLFLFLLPLLYFSIISVVSYFLLMILLNAIVFRIYKYALDVAKKTNERGNPFEKHLKKEITLPSDYIHEVVDVFIEKSAWMITKLRSLLLVENVFESLKMAAVLWCLTYVGYWFNGLTIVLLSVLGVFTFPKFYEVNREKIDHYLLQAKKFIENSVCSVKQKLGFKRKEQ
ncbi:reticulon-3-B-like [Tachypleus tridentatus]|uniref:reticulon-3-B-like n=1 Tax=Tachypleus tridentatus TaxID=6853 RepID=UPI003FCFAE30